MKYTKPLSRIAVSPIYTLAQSGTNKATNKLQKPQLIVNGKGTNLANTKALREKAKRKTITQKMVLGLIDVSKTKKQQVPAFMFQCKNLLCSC